VDSSKEGLALNTICSSKSIWQLKETSIGHHSPPY